MSSKPTRPRVYAVLAAGLILLAGCGDDATRTRTASLEIPDPPFVTRSSAEQPRAPNVLLIVVDTLRADHVGAFGSEAGLTPRLDALAVESHVFENAVAPSSWTRPSIAALLTSRFPTATGVLDKDDRLDSAAVTLPEVLQVNGGYQTFAVVTNGNVSAEYGFDQGYDSFQWPHLRRSYPNDFAIHVAEGVTSKVLELVDQAQHSRPFFLFALYVDPHDPYLPHADLMRNPEPPGRYDGSRKQLKKLGRARHKASEDDLDRIRHLYAGEVRYVDRWIGRLMDALRERGLYENLLIVVTSDHGEGLWDHGHRGHGNDLYEESVHVPLMIRLPGQVEGTRISQPVSLVDVAPTILNLASIDSPEPFLGDDLSPLFRQRERFTGLEYVYSELDHRGRSLESIRHGSSKLIRRRKNNTARGIPPWEVYDLTSDPEEKNPNSTIERRRVNRLRAALDKWSLATRGEAITRQQIDPGNLDPETLDSLRALGYLGGPAEPARRKSAPAAHEQEKENLPEVRWSAINFASGGPRGWEQVSGSLRPMADYRGARLADTAEVLLRRTSRHDKWIVEGIVEDDGKVPLAVAVSIPGLGQTSVELREPGWYVLEGRLPEGVSGTIRLTLSCSWSPEATSPAHPCFQVRQIALR